MHAKTTGKHDRPVSEPTYRGEGLTMIAIGLVCSYFYLYPALVLLHRGATSDILGRDDMMGIGMLPLIFGFGSLYGFGGRWAVSLIGPMEKPSLFGTLLGFVFLFLGFALMVWIDHGLALPG